jgi:glycosyltransferase involved in cell wall biosynthesis
VGQLLSALGGRDAVSFGWARPVVNRLIELHRRRQFGVYQPFDFAASAPARLKARPIDRPIRVAVVRGDFLGTRFVAEVERLGPGFEVVAFGTPMRAEERFRFTIPVRSLPVRRSYPDYGGLYFWPGTTELVGLEHALADFDVAYTTDVAHRITEQAVRARHLYGTRVVALQAENIPFNFEHLERNPIKCAVYDRVDLYAAIAEPARLALELEGVPPARIATVPFGVDLERFAEVEPAEVRRVRTALGILEGELAVLFAGRLIWEKGVHDLLTAVAIACRQVRAGEKPIRLVMIGDGGERPRLEARARWLGIRDRVTFAAGVPFVDMPAVYRACSVLVLPSKDAPDWREQFGQVLTEAMASGLPIIASNSGAIPWTTGDAAILVPPGDPVALAGAIRRLRDDEELAASLACRGRARAEATYGLPKVASQLAELFCDVLDRDGVPGTVGDLTIA